MPQTPTNSTPQPTQSKGTQAGPPAGHAPAATVSEPLDGSATEAASGTAGGSQQPPLTEKQAKQAHRRELLLQAKRRKDETARRNRANPPKPEDQWMCEFCEYEAIFGVRPKALIRGYEEKERNRRLAEDERHKVLERAKARSRKGKKGSKLPAKNSASPTTQQGDIAQTQPLNSRQNDYYDDEYDEDEEFDPDEGPPPLIPAPQLHIARADFMGGGGGGGGGSGGGTPGTEAGQATA